MVNLTDPMRSVLLTYVLIVSGCSSERRVLRSNASDSTTETSAAAKETTARRGADLMTVVLDSVAEGTGRYIEATRSYVPAPDTTHWLIVTRRADGDVVRVVRGPVAFTAPEVAILALGVRAADSVGVGTCRVNHGTSDRQIVAVLKYLRAEWLPAVRAWRFVRATPHFEPLPAAQVECLNEEGD